jgi:3-phosphoglycerate kinase
MRSCDKISDPQTKVAIRLDLNVNYDAETQSFVNHSRHKAHSTTINNLKKKNIKIILLSHNDFGGSEVMKRNAEILEKYIDSNVRYTDEKHPSAIFDEMDDEVVLYQNLSDIQDCMTEYDSIKQSSNTQTVKEFSSQIDAYINDCFSLSHRKIPTITGIPSKVPSYSGQFLESEYNIIKNIRDKTNNSIFVFGGDKIIRNISNIEKIFNADIDSTVLTMGLTGSVFLEADGYDLGSQTRSCIENRGSNNIVDKARQMLVHYGDKIRTPDDVATTNSSRSEYALSATPITDKVTDVGSETYELYNGLIENKDLVVATGVTSSEKDPKGERKIYEKISDTDYSIVVGDESVSFCDTNDLTGFSHTSSYIDPVIEVLVMNDLPGINVLLP